MMKANNEFFETLENRELEDPSVPIIGDDGAPFYTTRQTRFAMTGHSILTDFGKMRSFEPGKLNAEWCMPDLYRAPEVLLKLSWHHSVDVWSVAVMVCKIGSLVNPAATSLTAYCPHQTLELLEGKNVFDPIDHTQRQYVLSLALAQYIGYLGPPPLDLIKQSPLFSTYFDEAGESANLPSS